MGLFSQPPYSFSVRKNLIRSGPLQSVVHKLIELRHLLNVLLIEFERKAENNLCAAVISFGDGVVAEITGSEGLIQSTGDVTVDQRDGGQSGQFAQAPVYSTISEGSPRPVSLTTLP